MSGKEYTAKSVEEALEKAKAIAGAIALKNAMGLIFPRSFTVLE